MVIKIIIYVNFNLKIQLWEPTNHQRLGRVYTEQLNWGYVLRFIHNRPKRSQYYICFKLSTRHPAGCQCHRIVTSHMKFYYALHTVTCACTLVPQEKMQYFLSLNLTKTRCRNALSRFSLKELIQLLQCTACNQKRYISRQLSHTLYFLPFGLIFLLTF